ncbi:hypothetical protein BMS3Abin17_00206 [archaeon BMS3Abin17]|nr:hypothetical protein BMS3Abin17_00206 [archaeon BMS3Abin17]HDZ61509.1 winged helix-turn-helix transcriptional regulator [Candidatus Pacearchaeota archaeon]
MKINRNEKFLLRLLLENPDMGNNEISERLKITPQAVGKIRKQLISKEIIKSSELTIDYEKFGVGLHALVLIKVHPAALKKNLNKLKSNVLKPVYAIRSYALPQTDVTHIIIYAFKNIREYDDYFKKMQEDFGELVEIKNSYVFSSRSIIKSSSKDLFIKLLSEMSK